jgi:hypothetical protein
MPRSIPPLALPAEPLADQIPLRFASRPQLAQIHQRYYGPASPRTFERWPLHWRIVNGWSVADVAEFLAEAERRFRSVPVLAGGRRDA